MDCIRPVKGNISVLLFWLPAKYKRVTYSKDTIKDSPLKSAQDAYEVGFVDENPNLSEIYDLTLLNEVLKEKGLEVIAE